LLVAPLNILKLGFRIAMRAAARQRADPRHDIARLAAVGELDAARGFTALCLIAAQRIVDIATSRR